MTDVYGNAWPYRRIAVALALVAVLSGLTFATLLVGRNAPAASGDEDIPATIDNGSAALDPPETVPPKMQGGISPSPPSSGVDVAEAPGGSKHTGADTATRPKSDPGGKGDPGAGVSGTEDLSGGAGATEQLTFGDQRVAVQFLHSNGAALALLGSFITFVLTSVGSLTTIIIGWRQERRHDREWTLKIAQLELQLTERKQSVTVRNSSRRKGPPNK